MDEYDPIYTCERCEEYYDRTADWDDGCYCESCAKEEFPVYWAWMKQESAENYG